jgi:cell division protein FtsL
MTRFNALLLVMLMASGLYLVKVAYQTRSLFVSLDRAQSEERNLDTEYEKLQVEKRGQATPLRVEKMAREKLGMSPATPAVTQYVEIPATATAATAAATGGWSPEGLPLRPGEESSTPAQPVRPGVSR